MKIFDKIRKNFGKKKLKKNLIFNNFFYAKLSEIFKKNFGKIIKRKGKFWQIQYENLSDNFYENSRIFWIKKSKEKSNSWKIFLEKLSEKF